MAGIARTSEAPIHHPFRHAAIATGALVAAIWIVQFIDVGMHYSLVYRFGIWPRWPSRLGDILSAPFLHFSYQHIESNTPPLALTSFLVALRGIRRFVAISVVVIVIDGLGVWSVSPAHSVTAGASGLIFGYIGFLLARGIFDRRFRDILIALFVGVMYWWTLPLLVPGIAGISWQDHLFGLLGGGISAWVFRQRQRQRHRAARSSQSQVEAVAVKHVVEADVKTVPGARSVEDKADIFTLAPINREDPGH